MLLALCIFLDLPLCANDFRASFRVVDDGRYWRGMAENAGRLLRVPIGWKTGDWSKFALIAGDAGASVLTGLYDDSRSVGPMAYLAAGTGALWRINNDAH